jgi:hypothetical protein
MPPKKRPKKGPQYWGLSWRAVNIIDSQAPKTNQKMYGGEFSDGWCGDDILVVDAGV